MSILSKIIGWVNDAVQAVTDIRDDTSPADREKRDRAADKALGKQRVIAAAKTRGIEVDPDSIHDVLELLRAAVGEGFSGDRQFRDQLAKDLGIDGYTGTAGQNIELLGEVYVMVGHGGIKNPDAPTRPTDRPAG
jgi:hypothetical protein